MDNNMQGYVHVAILLKDNEWTNVILFHNRTLDPYDDISYRILLEDSEKFVKNLISDNDDKILQSNNGILPIVLGIVAYKIESSKNAHYNDVYILDMGKDENTR